MALVIISCSNQNELDAIGKWDDNIILSTREVSLNQWIDSAVVTTQGNGWWITGIAVDGDQFYDFQGIDMTAENFMIQAHDLFLEKRDYNTIFIRMGENNSSSKRLITIGLEAGNYFDCIQITQKGR